MPYLLLSTFNTKHLYVKGYIILALNFSFNCYYNNCNCKNQHSIARFVPRLLQNRLFSVLSSSLNNNSADYVTTIIILKQHIIGMFELRIKTMKSELAISRIRLPKFKIDLIKSRRVDRMNLRALSWCICECSETVCTFNSHVDSLWLRTKNI